MTVRKQRLDKETFVYGIAVHESGEVYGFNRNYHVLPRKPSQDEVKAIMADPDTVSQNRAYGKGRFKPPPASCGKGWTTYWRRLSGVIEWVNYDYPWSYYEAA